MFIVLGWKRRGGIWGGWLVCFGGLGRRFGVGFSSTASSSGRGRLVLVGMGVGMGIGVKGGMGMLGGVGGRGGDCYL